MDRGNANKISLDGDLSMIGVTEQFPLLAQYLATPAEAASVSSEQHPMHEIDLSRVRALDACGCQLLVAFVHNLRKRGAAASVLNVTDECRDIIRSLGFNDELLAEAAHEA